jgi:hypothetical protein
VLIQLLGNQAAFAAASRCILAELAQQCIRSSAEQDLETGAVGAPSLREPELNASPANQGVAGAPTSSWETYRRIPATYAAWASICTDDWIPVDAVSQGRTPLAAAGSSSCSASLSCTTRAARRQRVLVYDWNSVASARRTRSHQLAHLG